MEIIYFVLTKTQIKLLNQLFSKVISENEKELRYQGGAVMVQLRENYGQAIYIPEEIRKKIFEITKDLKSE